VLCFTKLYWRNFFASGQQGTLLQLDKAATTLVIGTNGSGKSTILDALCFSLFGKPFRKVKKEEMINTINGGDCLVEVDFSIGTRQYKVRRGIKPNMFELYEDGILVNQDASVRDYQEYLEKNILQVSYETFIQVVILGNAKYTPFMQLKAQDRREFVEHVLDIGVFSVMHNVLKERSSSVKGQLSEIAITTVSVKEQINLIEGFIKKLEADQQKASGEIEVQIQNHTATMNGVLGEIEKLKHDIMTAEIEIEDAETTEDTLRKLEGHKAKFQQNLEAALKRIDFYETTESCKTCGQDIDKGHRDTIIAQKQRKIGECENGLKLIAPEINKQKARLEDIKVVNKRIRTLSTEMQVKQSSVNATRQYITKLQGDLVKKPANVKEQQNKQAELQATQKQLEIEKKEALELQQYYDVATSMLKDSGIKAAIIRQYLPLMNKLVNKYLVALDFFVSFSLDEKFDETIKKRGRDRISYMGLSQGEKLRIDLALLFAWREIAKTKNSCATNLLMLDEVIDSSLDVEGTDLFIKMLNSDLQEGTNAFVISHKDSGLDKFQTTLQFVLDKQFSRLVEQV
jgi:DNA repair exonuclease SbcCD ATPase subunit